MIDRPNAGPTGPGESIWNGTSTRYSLRQPQPSDQELSWNRGLG